MVHKPPKLEHVKLVRSKGKTYAYFNTGQKKDGKAIYARLPDPASPGFFASYAAFRAGRTRRQSTAYTIAHLAREYEASAKFAELAKGTQVIYGKTIRRIVSLLGDFPVNDLQRSDLQTVLDHDMAGPGAHNIFLAVVGVLYKWGHKRDKTDLRPTEGIDKARMGTHEPWPEHVLEAGLTAEHDRTRLAVHLLYFTGQRIGDVVKLRWSDIRRGKVNVKPEKTKRFGKELSFPVHSELQAELHRTPRRGITILADDAGAPVRAVIIREELQRFTAGMGYKTVPHGLRKNAVNSLLEAGATVAEVASITGQTLQVIEHYAARVNQSALGESVILKLEQKRSKKV